VKRYLITTADERTWKFDRPSIFLGEWCRNYDRKHIWSKMDFVVAKPYGLGQFQRDKDYAQARLLEDQLFPVLCDVLNQHHGTQHGSRFWRIILGGWLRVYIHVIYNRSKTIEQCLQTYELSGTTIFGDDSYSLATFDLLSLHGACNDDQWNSILYAKVFEQLGGLECPVEVISCPKTKYFRWAKAVRKGFLNELISKQKRKIASKVMGLLVRDNDAFITNSYLPVAGQIKLALALGQAPQLWFSQNLELTSSLDKDLRKKLSNKVVQKKGNASVHLFHSLLFELLPICYLEGFSELRDQASELKRPKTPRFIFTSNDFYTDELFKVWTASKTEIGIPYIVGQHGNGYGTHRYENPTIEEATSDKFLTWGWTDGLPQHKPTTVLKTVGRKLGRYDRKGGLLLIESAAIERITIEDNLFEFSIFWKEQQTFVRELGGGPRNALCIRLYPRWRDYTRSEEKRWRQFDGNLKIDDGREKLGVLIARNRLVVHSYDSTGILETLSQNIPTIAFWQNGLEHLRDNAKPYYQLLIDVGIVHLLPESAAQQVNKAWENVERWWSSDYIQAAREKFCDRYARSAQNPIKVLTHALRS